MAAGIGSAGKAAKQVSKFFGSSGGDVKPGPLAEKIGAAVGGAAIESSLSAEAKAADAAKLLKKSGSPTYKTTGADLTSLAKDNPKASAEELAKLYLGEGAPVSPKQKDTTLQIMQAAQPPAPSKNDYRLYSDGSETDETGITSFEGLANRETPGMQGMGALEPTPTTEGVLVGKGETAAQKYARDQKKREAEKAYFKQSRNPTVQRFAPEAAVNATPEVTAEVPPVDIPGNKFPTKKVVGGVAAAGTVAATLAGRKDPEEKAPTTASIVGEIPTSGPFKGKIAPTQEEKVANRNIPWDYYKSLNEEADRRIEQQKEARKLAGLSSLSPQQEVKIRQQVLDEARKKLSPEDEKAAADGKLYFDKVYKDAVIPGGARTDGILGRGSQSALAPGGVGKKPTDTQPVTPGKESQATTPPVTATGAIKDMGALAAALEKGKSDKVSKASLDALTLTLDGVEAEVSADSRFQNTPIASNLQSARAEAYKMYKEKADRNQLLGTVERAINAIAQFASAQAGFGTRQAGGNLPLSTADYGGQTAQAFKEYETEVGLIGEEQKAGERASDRKELLKEKEIGRRQKTILERIKLGSDELAQAAAEKRARIAEGGKDYTRTSRENAAAKKELFQKNKVALGGVAAEIKTISAQLDAINELAAASKTSDRNDAVVKYATKMGIPVEEVNAGIDKEDKWWESDRTTSFAAKRASELAKELERLNANRAAIVSKLSGGDDTAAEDTSVTAPAGQAAASSGTVWRRGKDGILYEYDAVTKKPTGNKEQ